MPINYENGLTFSYDYNELEKHLMSKKFFSNEKVQRDFIQKWIQKIKTADKQSITDFTITSKQQRYFYQQVIINPNNFVCLAFYVPKLLAYTKKKEPIPLDVTNAIFFDIDCKQEPPSKKSILYYKTKLYPTCSQLPIIIWKNQDYDYPIVIDGNHRVNHHIANNTQINFYYLIKEDDLMDLNLFIDDFCFYFFRMIREIKFLTTRFETATNFQKTKFSEQIFIKRYSWIHSHHDPVSLDL